MVPLIVLYEGSVILARIFGRPRETSAEAELNVTEPPPSGPA
jgi:Sec-independent protein secretion pathway component TatC